MALAQLWRGAATTRRVGEAYFMALSALGVGSDIVVTCELQRPLAVSRAIAAFGELLEQWPALRYRRVRRGTEWHWRPPQDGAWRLAWQQLSDALARGESPTAADGGDQLPLRLSACSEVRLVFRLDHTFGNGRAALVWIERYFQRLSAASTGPAEAPSGRRQRLQAGGPLALFPALRYLSRHLRLRQRLTATGTDLRQPLMGEATDAAPGYWEGRFVWSQQELQQRLLRHAGAAESFSQVLTRRLVEHTLASCQELRGLGIDVVADMHDTYRIPPPGIGNFTVSLLAYVDRAAPIEGQIGALFGHLQAGLPRGIGQLMRLLSPTLPRLAGRLRGDLARAMGGAGVPMLDNLYTVSSVGRIEAGSLRQWARTLSLRTYTHAIYVSATTINGATAFEVTYPVQLFDSTRVEAVIRGFFEPAAAPQECLPTTK